MPLKELHMAHQSLPANPLIAESMYLLGYIKKTEAGTVDMIRCCAEAGLPELEFKAGAGFITRIWRVGRNGQHRRSGHATTHETRRIW